MSTDNQGLLVGGLILAYLYMKRKQAVAVAYAPNGTIPASMPANVGSGLQQVKVGAIAGLLQALASNPVNNTSQTVFPVQNPTTNYGAVQDVVNAPADLSGMLDDNVDTTWWA